MLGLRTCVYKVNNMKKAKEWYSLAFKKKPYFDEEYYIGFNIGGFELALQPEEGQPTNKTNNLVSYWGVNDIQATFKNLLDIGATEHEKPFNVGGDLMAASVLDPWGNCIGIIYNPDFKLKQ